MNFRALLLFPFALVNAIVLRVRHFCYDNGAIPSSEVNVPMIRIGNLSLGGTGKTPFTEYVLRSFAKEWKMGMVSRGYGRKSQGIHEVLSQDSARTAGDEALQVKKKFPHVPVFLSSIRTQAIEALKSKYSKTELIVLDDALQHRKLKGGFKILLSDISKPFYQDFLFPSGTLRDLKYRAKDVDVIVLTKIDSTDFDSSKVSWVKQELKKYEKPIFFTSLKYFKPVSISNGMEMQFTPENVLLLTGIASSESLKIELINQGFNLSHLAFKDHHAFSKEDFIKIKEKYESLQSDSVIFTTEKDTERIITHPNFEILKDLPIYSIGIEINFLNREEEFKSLIRDYVKNY